MLNETDKSIITDCSWALSYLTNCNEDQLQYCLKFNIIKAAKLHLDPNNIPAILLPCLRIIGNVASEHLESTSNVNI